MKKSILRISAVSYINSKPFVYGIEKSGFLKNYSLSLDVPSVCAQKLLNNKVDIGLAPVAILSKLKNFFILPDYCISSKGPVLSVMLYSNVPLNKIKNILLDNQSKTSIILVRILANYFWKIAPKWISAKNGYEEKIKGTIAGVIIGDRNFSLAKKFKYAYDLSEEWMKFTGLPFVFACWISNRKLNSIESSSFKKALKYGLDNKRVVIKQLANEYDRKLMHTYLYSSINYKFDLKKHAAMQLFSLLSKTIK